MPNQYQIFDAETVSLVSAIGSAVGGLAAAVSAAFSYIAIRRAQQLGRDEDKRRYAEQVAALVSDCCELIRYARGNIVSLDFELPNEFKNISDNNQIEKIKLAIFAANHLSSAYSENKFSSLISMQFPARIHLSDQVSLCIRSIYSLRNKIIAASRDLAKVEANLIKADFDIKKYSSLVFGKNRDDISSKLGAYESAIISFVRQI